MDEEKRQKKTERFLELVQILNRELHTGPYDQWRGLDLTIPQIKTLVLLDHSTRMRMGEISNELGSTVSATTNIVDRLVEKGMVERRNDDDDRRVVNCWLTPQGQDAVERLWHIREDQLLEVSKRLDANQLEAVVDALEELRVAVKDVCG